tara:strand:- start:282 stop:509 length:228 start_codon:yes stop_codon:yes gene_type:complete
MMRIPSLEATSTLLGASHDQSDKQAMAVRMPRTGLPNFFCGFRIIAPLEWKERPCMFQEKGNGTFRQDEDLSLIN